MNRYVQLQRYAPNLYTPPMELLGKAMELAQQRYDTNLAAAQEIKDQLIPSLPQDRARADELQQMYSQQVDDVVAAYNGDYSQATYALNDLTRKIKKDFGPGGEAGAIIQNYSTYQNWLKESQDLVEKGKVLGEDLNLAHNYFLNNFQGTGQKDPVTGNFNQFRPDILTEYANPEEMIQKLANDFKPEKKKVARTIFKDGLKTDIVEEVEEVTSERLYPSFKAALTSDPKIMQYLKQKAKFAGVPEESIPAFIDAYSKERAEKLATRSTTDSRLSDRDPLAMLYTKHKLDKDLLTQAAGPFLQYEPTIPTKMQESTISPDNFSDFYNYTGALTFGLAGTGAPGALGLDSPAASKQWSTKFNKPFAELIKDPLYLEKSKVNPELAQALHEYNISTLDTDPAKAQAIFNAKYGKDSKWSKEFDKKTVKMYKDNEPRFSRVQPISYSIVSPEANEQTVKRIAGQLLNPEGVEVYKPGEGLSVRASDFKLTYNDLITEDGVIPQASYVPVQEGFPELGVMMNTKKGTFVFPDANTNRRNYAKQGLGAIDQVTNQGLKRSVTPLIIQNQPVGYLESKIVVNNGVAEKMLFIDDGKQLYPTSIEQIAEKIVPELEGVFGAGETKAQNTLFKLRFQ